MYACEVPITILRCDGLHWDTWVVEDVSWFSESVGSLEGRGLQKTRQISCRIPSASAPEELPRVGDYVILGRLEGVESMAELDGFEFGRLVRVADNRRGIPALQHIALTAV